MENTRGGGKPPPGLVGSGGSELQKERKFGGSEKRSKFAGSEERTAIITQTRWDGVYLVPHASKSNGNRMHYSDAILILICAFDNPYFCV